MLAATNPSVKREWQVHWHRSTACPIPRTFCGKPSRRPMFTGASEWLYRTVSQKARKIFVLGQGFDGGGGEPDSCEAHCPKPIALACQQCRDGARGVFTDQVQTWRAPRAVLYCCMAGERGSRSRVVVCFSAGGRTCKWLKHTGTSVSM